MSLCDVCYKPGACCQDLVLTGGNPGDGFFGDPDMSRDRALEIAENHGLPFVPLRVRENGSWSYSCSKLGPDGRCTIYEDRPDLCRRYEPMEDGLCVMAHGTEAGDASAGEVPAPKNGRAADNVRIEE